MTKTESGRRRATAEPDATPPEPEADATSRPPDAAAEPTGPDDRAEPASQPLRATRDHVERSTETVQADPAVGDVPPV